MATPSPPPPPPAHSTSRLAPSIKTPPPLDLHHQDDDGTNHHEIPPLPPPSSSSSALGDGGVNSGSSPCHHHATASSVESIGSLLKEETELVLVEELQLSYGSISGPSFRDILTGAATSFLNDNDEEDQEQDSEGSSPSSSNSRTPPPPQPPPPVKTLPSSLNHLRPSSSSSPSSPSASKKPITPSHALGTDPPLKRANVPSMTNSTDGSSSSATVAVESSKIARVIGRAGATIKAIEKKTGCTLNVVQRESAVIITGSSAARVQAAERLVVVARDEGLSTRFAAALEETVIVEGGGGPSAATPPQAEETTTSKPPPSSSSSNDFTLEVRLVMARPPEASTFTQYKLPVSVTTTLRQLKELLEAKVGVAIGEEDRVVVRGKVWGAEDRDKTLKEVGVGVAPPPPLVIVVHEEKESVLEMMVKTPRGSRLPLLDLRPSMTVLDLKRRLSSMPRFQGMVTDSTTVSIEGLGTRPQDHLTLREVGVDQGWKVQLMVAGSRRGKSGGVCILIYGPTSQMMR